MVVPAPVAEAKSHKPMMAKDFGIIASLCGASILLAPAPFTYGAEAPSHPDAPILRMHFLTNSAGETLVRYNDLSGSQLKNTNKLVNVTRMAATKGAQFSLIPEDSIVDLTSEQFAGWAAQIPLKQSMRFSFDYPQSMIDLETSDLNQQPVVLSFSDGAKAQMNGNAKGRLEVMNDGSYAFFGAGPMAGVNADGVAVRFGTVFPPLFGGKLSAPKSTNGAARFARATPVTQVTFLGQMGSGLQARIGDKLIALEPDKAMEAQAQNGARVSMVYNSSKREVDWTVHRGLIRFTVDSFNCWKALGTSGQSASMQWDTNGFLLEIKNNSGPSAFQRTLLVNLNPNLNVAIGESASFQYGRTGDCSTFVTSARGGETVLYNSQTGRYVRLDEGNMNIISGNPDTVLAGAQNIPRTKLKLGWNEDDQIELSGANGTVTVPVTGEQTFQPGPGEELNVGYRGTDELILHADTGAFAVTPDILPNIAIEMSEGAGVTLGLDRGSDIFRVQTPIENVGVVGLRTPTGFYPTLQPGTRVTFVINRSTFTSDGDDGTLIFTETAGAGAPTVTGGITVRPVFNGRGDVTFFGGPPTEPRVDQPPVTTLE